MAAACRLIEKLGGQIAGLTFLIELSAIQGRAQLGNYPVHSVIVY
jgi:adenine phosphoribosyltransferase